MVHAAPASQQKMTQVEKLVQNTHDQSRTKVQGKLGDSNEVHW